jgi:hypothetical protein
VTTTCRPGPTALALALALALSAPRLWAQQRPAATPTAQPASAAPTSQPASPETAPGSTADARAAFERGVAAMDEGRYADAVRAFEESYRLRPEPVVLYNLGLALRGAGRSLEAIDAFERYLRGRAAGTASPTEPELRAEITRLQGTLVMLNVEVRPAGATVYVDGRPQTLAGGAVRLDPGDHVIEVSAEGYVSRRRPVTLSPGGQLHVDIALDPVGGSGRLVVDASVSTATITIDGERAGAGHAERPEPEGPHLVEIQAPGYSVYRRTVRVGPTGAVRLDATLSPAQGLSPAAITGIIAAGALVAGGIITAVILATQPQTTYPLYEPSLGNVYEGVH